MHLNKLTDALIIFATHSLIAMIKKNARNDKINCLNKLKLKIEF